LIVAYFLGHPVYILYLFVRRAINNGCDEMRRNKDVSKSELRAQIVQPAKKEQNQPLILFFSYFAQFGISPYISVLCFYWEAQKPPSIPSNWRGPRKQGAPKSSKARKF